MELYTVVLNGEKKNLIEISEEMCKFLESNKVALADIYYLAAKGLREILSAKDEYELDILKMNLQQVRTFMHTLEDEFEVEEETKRGKLTK